MTQAEFYTALKEARSKYKNINLGVERDILKTYINAADEVAKKIKTLEINNRGTGLTAESLRSLEKSLRTTGREIAGITEQAIINGIDTNTTILNYPNVKYINDAIDIAGIEYIEPGVISEMYATINKRVIDITYSRLFSDGYTFSNRIWGIDGELPGLSDYWNENIKQIINSGIAQNRDILEIAQDLQVYAQKGKPSLVKRYGPLERETKKFIKRIPKNIDWRALRLARSELYASIQEAAKIQGKENPAVKEYIWNLTSGSVHECICPDLAANSPYLENEIPDFPHANCYIGGTEVYTKRGWIDFRNLKKDDIFLSMNPDTFNYEWVGAIDFQKIKVNENLVKFKSKWFEMITTKNHRNYVKAAGAYRWLTSDEIHKNKYSYSAIPRYGNWIGCGCDFINIGNYQINPYDYCEFMGYYLAEGNVSRHSGYNASNRYFGTISQNEGIKKDKMWMLFKRMPFKITKSKIGFYFGDNSVCLYLLQFGKKSWLKKVPEVIKALMPKYIKVFLDAYILGDGNIKESKKNKINIKSISRVVFTSSIKMRDDLGELMIKAGGYPSFYKTKAIETKFKNGTYMIKHPCWIISWNKSRSAYKHKLEPEKGIKSEYVEYNGYVYDITLKKNHILWVKYNNKTCFSGNCLCYITFKIMSRDEFVQDLIDWGNGATAPYLDNWYKTVYLPYVNI